MDECFRCGVSGEKVRLYDAISGKGIVKICSDCASIEKIPIIRKPTDNQIAESQRQKSVRDMLTGANRGKLLARREISLRELVDRNLKERLAKQPSDLIDNFHWTIQRIRRNKKVTREQFAKGIGESEATVRMLEQGILPNNDYKLVNKVESYLGVTLRKAGSSTSDPASMDYMQSRSGFPETKQVKQIPKRLDFDRETASQLKIADLREMKKRQEEAKKPIDSWEEERSQDDEKFLDEDEEDFFEDEE